MPGPGVLRLPSRARRGRVADRGSLPDAQDPAKTPAAVCRICLEAEGEGGAEDAAPLLQPCRCAGTAGHVHQACLQRWINEKGDRRCEICGATFGAGFSDPPPRRGTRRAVVVVRGENGEYEVVEGEGEEEEDDDEAPPRANACVACCFSVLLLLLILPLANHLAEELRNQAPDPRPGVPWEGSASCGDG